MLKRIVILGGGTGGTLTANRLQRHFKHDDVSITVVDQDGDHVYQPGLLFVPFGLSQPEDIVRSRERQLAKGIVYIEKPIERVDIETDTVVLEGNHELPYDVLVIATGSRLVPEETEGLTGPGWGTSAFTFYDLPGATALEQALESFDGGRLVVNMVDLPVKCPVAPLEFCFLADWYFHQREMRDRVQITYVTPLDAAFTKPVASRTLQGLLAEKGIELVTEFNTGQVEYATNEDASPARGGKLVGYDGREVEFDLAAVVPLHSGAEFVSRSPGLGDELGFVRTDPSTLQSKVKENIFAIGDATDVPASKAGSVTHFEGDVLTENLIAFLEGDDLDASYDGHANCFVETGFSKALLIDFNYDTEPLPGHFPGPVGLPLLKESRLNHLGKLMFQWFYWHSLLPGRDIPGITTDMPHFGKRGADSGTDAADSTDEETSA
ncbi:MAG: FAD/NAD(P)-binding oxidoreductase [Ilumatobacteraceae bacterium]|nr:MAG: NAD(P)/FAD-dependent oxidoreductase [Actinomycetota bacterium]